MAYSNTVFAQLLKGIDRHHFDRPYRSQRKYRTLSRFTILIFAQLTGRASFRDICDSLQIQAGRLSCLGVHQVKASTRADANSDRPAELYQAFLEKVYQRCAALAPGK